MENKKSYIGIKNSVDTSTVELYFTDFIFDSIDWDMMEMTNMVQDTIDQIKAANPSTIKVTINSLGGDVMIGLGIYNFLKNYDADVEVEIIGFAASIASIMAMSASKGKLKMAKNSFMIIHSASSYAGGNANDLREQADVLDTISGQMADIYAQRTGKKATYFTDLWADGSDIWYTGKEALKLGLVDELTNAEPMTAKVNLASYGFKNIPTKIFNQLTQNLNSNSMAFEKTLISAKAQSFTVADGGFLLEEAQLNNIENELAAAVTVKAELETANASVVALKDTNTGLGVEIVALKEKETIQLAFILDKDAKIAELEAKVTELGKAPSGTGTIVKTKGDESPDKAPVASYASESNPANAWVDKMLSRRKPVADKV